ncbi:MAG: hypothetical protein IJM81_00025 [Prevotella sp.]|nr:hypothetical protein [Prevotella sp.]
MRIIFIFAGVLFYMLTTGAQTMNVHMVNGEVVRFSKDDIAYIDFTLATPVPESYKVCPDDSHPHLIDLGLPSGTKWACCNVGASSPEEHGGYYSWGETEEKSEYTQTTYKYFNQEEGWNNLGTDIAGTVYDVAHVKWGGAWQMPTLAQCEELVSSCKWSDSFVEKNGVKGRVLTGANGGSIFLPASGWYYEMESKSVDAGGYYWTSTQIPDRLDNIHSLDFYTDMKNCGGLTRRDAGLSVRPVIVP